MPSILNWESDGVVASAALALYGVVVFAIAVSLGSRVRGLRKLLPAAIVWHVIVFLFLSLWFFPFYAAQTGLDAYVYHHDAINIANLVRAGQFEKIPSQLGTAAVPVIAAILYMPFGGNIYGMLFFCSALSLLSGIIIVKAYSKSLGTASESPYRYYILFLPSIAMWTSTMGKDSIVAFGIALMAYGVSAAFRGGLVRGLLPLSCGLALVALVRIHIALVLIVAAAMAALWPQVRSGRVSRLGTAALLIGLIAILVPVAADFVGLRNLTLEGVLERQFDAGDKLSYGGSTFDQGGDRDSGFGRIPVGMWNVLARPYPWEVNNPNVALAACENLVILWLVVCALRNPANVWSWVRANPYLLFCAFAGVGLLLLLSQSRNAGLNSRQRVQLLPFLLAALLVPKPRRRLSPDIRL